MAKWPVIPAGGSGVGGVPASLDAISVDFYNAGNTNGTDEVEKNKAFYTSVIFPRLHPHQQALFVPGIYASNPVRKVLCWCSRSPSLYTTCTYFRTMWHVL